MEAPEDSERPLSRSNEDYQRPSSGYGQPVQQQQRQLRFAEEVGSDDGAQTGRHRFGGRQSKFLGLLKIRSKESGSRHDGEQERGRASRASLMPERRTLRMSSVPALQASPQLENKNRNSSVAGLDGAEDVQNPHRHAIASGKERAPRALGEPLPLCSAYDQAIKHGSVTAPVGSVDAILKAHRLQSLAAKDDTDLPESDPKRKRPSSPNPAETFTTKIFVLTSSGHLLQYSAEGEQNRKPERIMQLNAGSAAMACDAVPGKHWVLRISETFTEDEPPSNARISRFALPRLGLGGKKGPENFLLIMESPDELGAWLNTVRREIQSLGAVNYKPDQLNTPFTENEIEESIDPRSTILFSPPPKVVIERTASQIRRKPVSGSSPTESTASSQNYEESLAKPDLMWRAYPETEARSGEQGRSVAAGLTADHLARPSQQPCYHDVTESPTLETTHVGNRPSSRESSSYSNQVPVESTRPATLRTTAATGRRRSSSIQSLVHATLTPSSGDRVVEDIMSRPRSSSQALSPSKLVESPNRRYTGLRKKAYPTTVSHSPNADTYNQPSGNSPVRPKTSPSLEPPLPSTLSASSDRVSLSAGFSRVSPGSDLGPVVLTPPDSPETEIHPQTASLVKEIHSSPNTAQLSGGTAQNEQSLARQEAGETEQGHSEDEDGEEITTAQFMALSSMETPTGVPIPSVEAAQINAALVAARQDSYPSGDVAVAVPITAGRSVQVDVVDGNSFQRGPGRSFTLGLIGSLRPESADSAGGVVVKKVSREERFSEKGSKKSVEDQVVMDKRKGNFTSVTVTEELSPTLSSSSMSPPPRQSSLIYSSSLVPKALAPGRSVSQPVHSMPLSQPRKDSKVSMKTAQLRQRLVEIDVSRLPQATNALLLAPSPHPAPTVALPPLPPGAHPPRAFTMPQLGAKNERVRASSLVSQRNANNVGIASSSSREPSGPFNYATTPEQGGNPSHGSDKANSSSHIVETTRPRKPKVDRITLTPMSNVVGMAGRRRERSGSPGDLRGRARSGSPHARNLATANTGRLNERRPSSLAHHDSLKSLGLSERDMKREMEQIEADLNALDEARQRRAREAGGVATNAEAGPRASTFEEILIGLGISPRTAPQFADCDVPPTPPRKDTPKGAALTFPKRRSSLGYGDSLNVPDQDQRSRVITIVEEGPVDNNPLASNPVAAPDLQSLDTVLTQPCPPPEQPLPPLPAQQKAASMSAISAAAASIASPSSVATKPSPDPNVLVSRLSPPITQHVIENRQRSHSSPRMQGHKRQVARHERIELPGSEVERHSAAVEVPASELSPPVRMQASLTDLSQDDFFTWSIPAFSGRDPTSGSLPSSMDQTFSPSELSAGTPMTQASGDGMQSHGRKESSQISPKGDEDYTPLNIPVLGMSLDGGFQQPTALDVVRDQGASLTPPRARGSRWSLFGAIEGIQ